MKLTHTSFKEKKKKLGEIAFFPQYVLDLWNFLVQDVNTRKSMWFEKTSRQIHEKVICQGILNIKTENQEVSKTFQITILGKSHNGLFQF